MTLPWGRDFTANAADPVSSKTLNRLQDCVIKNAKPAMSRAFGPGFTNTPASTGWNAFAGIAGTQNYLVSQAAAQPGYIVVPMTETGDRIIAIEALVYGDGVADCQFDTLIILENGDTSGLDSRNHQNQPALWEWVPLWTQTGEFWNRVLGVGEFVIVRIAPNAANFRLAKLRLLYDRPL
jgi:hypothetical protein